MKTKNAARLLSRRILTAGALLVVAVGLRGEAEAGWGLDITPYVGYQVGGSFEDNATGTHLSVDEGGAFGLIFDLSDTRETQYELFYGLQRTQVTGSGTFGGQPLFDLDIHYLHVGGTYLVSEGKKVRPYVAGGLGATHFVPHGEGMDRKTYFSLSLGGGAKIPISDSVGLRFEGRGFLTILPDATEIFCVSSGGAACSVRVQGDVLGQLLFLAGATFSL